MSFELALSPGGRLFTHESEEPGAAAPAELKAAFEESSAHGLEALAAEFLHRPLPASPAFWRDFAKRYFTALCHNLSVAAGALDSVPKPDSTEFEALVETAPPMDGLEYLNAGVLARLWDELEMLVFKAIQQNGGGAQAYLRAKNPAWNAVGRVTFHLAENKRNPELPFAFLATYTHGMSAQGKARHLPLGRALQEYAGNQNRGALTTLLSPVQRAAEKSKLAREMLETREIFHPQAWTPAMAYRFLKEIPLFEESGVTVRIPDWWKAGRPPRPQVSVRLGESKGKSAGLDSMLDFKIETTLDGEPLTDEEWRSIRNSTDGLALLKGKWVEVDGGKLKEVLDHWKKFQTTAGAGGVTLLQSLRMISGFQPGPSGDDSKREARAEWGGVVAGKWLRKVLDEIQNPGTSKESDPGAELRAELRPYQRQGVHWLWFMHRLGLGACLADDMGLGKTIQVISLLLALKRAPRATNPSKSNLLVVPASLIANWKAEIRKFAPSLSIFLAHPSETPAEQIAAVAASPAKGLESHDLVITSYALLSRQPWLKEQRWNVVILDEAQAIKNSGSRQSREAKSLQAGFRLALTGTPIENRLSDLWSLFDFICPGLLGGAADFAAFLKSSAVDEHQQFAPLRRLVRPYILRRLKTDKSVISDLPEKTELNAYCSLTRAQAVLYEQSVLELAEKLESPALEGIQRRGLVLAFLTRFKQICNHPSQWLGDGGYQADASGKFRRLRELCEEIAARQEKVLIFTQYREMTRPLAGYLSGIFGRPGLVLDGETAVKKRQDLVNEFQRDGGAPFFVLSLKAGGSGLNLTSATHVIHFDRWWNPAVENQATDRAFRIGQKRNVMVHKFICRGTLEERIHEMIAGKTALAEDILGQGGERLLTEMNKSELLSFVALDIKTVTQE